MENRELIELRIEDGGLIKWRVENGECFAFPEAEAVKTKQREKSSSGVDICMESVGQVSVNPRLK